MTPDEILAVARSAADPARKEFHSAYRSWLERLATLSTTALALLVSLQKSYVPQNPRDGWLLAVCWGSLCLATLCAAWALYGEAQSHREFLDHVRQSAAQSLHRAASTSIQDLQSSIGAIYERPTRFELAAGIAAVAFASALVSLTGWAILNL
jgi:hypothetical protein